jgi:hypothetical protein
LLEMRAVLSLKSAENCGITADTGLTGAASAEATASSSAWLSKGFAKCPSAPTLRPRASS